MIKLLEEWEVVLPHWLKNNIIEQLIIPKLKLEVDQWIPQVYFKNSTSNKNIPLHSILLPWLVIIDEERMHLHLFESVKNKLIVYLHNKPFLETEKDGGNFILQNLCSWLEVNIYLFIYLLIYLLSIYLFIYLFIIYLFFFFLFFYFFIYLFFTYNKNIFRF